MSPVSPCLSGVTHSPGWPWEDFFGFLSKISKERDAGGGGGQHQENKLI